MVSIALPIFPTYLKYFVGETEWAKNGRYTGTSEIELTPIGVKQVSNTGAHLVGPGKLIDPSCLAHIWVSPRKRAQTTSELLFGSYSDTLRLAGKVTTTEDIAEWDYGEYEGLKENEIREHRKQKGLDVHLEWDIWRDGCEGGDYRHRDINDPAFFLGISIPSKD
ncbi:MAG: hypothetical protein Q9165_005828 [Trypethelium subeluteriae]